MKNWSYTVTEESMPENYEGKYNAALERMKSWVRGEHPECFSEAQKAAEFIFPELKESEEEINERVRIGLIKAFNTIGKLKWGGLKVQDILTWLEKQQGKSALEAWRDMRFEVYQQASGNRHEPNYSDDSTKMFSLNDIDEIIEKISEQSHNDKIKQKFHKGAWVVSEVTGSVYQIKDCIENVTNHKYGYDLTNGKYIGSCEVNHYHLWTINDAKNGDVLAYVTDEEDLWIMIYRSLYEPYEGHVHYHALLVNDNFSDKGTCCICIDNLKPATKEQRDLLIEKMEQAGYEWDAEKKELKRIEQKPVDKVEPKFRVGNWVVQENIGTYKVIEVCESWYEVIDNQNNHCSIGFDKEDMCHLWTIQDAKDGDVLASGQVVFIFKVIRDGWLYCHCSFHNDGSLIAESYDMMTYKYFGEVHPATKEQRDLLFSKMKEDRYEWDADKKELKKIEPKKLDPDKVIEWIDEHVPTKFEDMQNYVNQFKKDFGL